MPRVKPERPYCPYCDLFISSTFSEHNRTITHLQNVDAYQTLVLEPMIRTSLTNTSLTKNSSGIAELPHPFIMNSGGQTKGNNLTILSVGTGAEQSEGIMHSSSSSQIVSKRDRMDWLEIAADVRLSHEVRPLRELIFDNEVNAIKHVRSEHAVAVAKEAQLRNISKLALPSKDKFGSDVRWCEFDSDKIASSSTFVKSTDITFNEEMKERIGMKRLRSETENLSNVSQAGYIFEAPHFSANPPPYGCVTVAGQTKNKSPLPSNPSIKIGNSQ